MTTIESVFEKVRSSSKKPIMGLPAAQATELQLRKSQSRIQSLEKTIEYMDSKHKELLRDLHVELRTLQDRISDTTNKSIIPRDVLRQVDPREVDMANVEKTKSLDESIDAAPKLAITAKKYDYERQIEGMLADKLRKATEVSKLKKDLESYHERIRRQASIIETLQASLASHTAPTPPSKGRPSSGNSRAGRYLPIKITDSNEGSNTVESNAKRGLLSPQTDMPRVNTGSQPTRSFSLPKISSGPLIAAKNDVTAMDSSVAKNSARVKSLKDLRDRFESFRQSHRSI